MNLISKEIEKAIDIDICSNILSNNFKIASFGIEKIIDSLYDEIPANKRISYGIVHTVKILGQYLYSIFEKQNFPIFETASAIFNCSEKSESRAVSLCIISYFGLIDYKPVLPYFEMAAADNDWELREISQMLFRKIIKTHPEEARSFLLKLVVSENLNVRRFVGETLRPVVENKWFYKNPEYPLSVLRYLFKESKAYPRTSAGNNLSDLSRNVPELIYKIVEELVQSGDKNSYWIAYRACRNLVKKDPEHVMILLKTDKYKYKDRMYGE